MSTPAPYRYTTLAAVVDLLAPDPDDTGTAASMDSEAILAEIAAAEDRIDADLARRYGRHIPFDPVPPIITRIARDIAAYNCDLTYRGAARFQFGDYDPILMRYRTAIDLLDRISRGYAELAVPDLDESSTASSGGRAGAPRNPHGRLFGEERLCGSSIPSRVDQPWVDRWPYQQGW